MPQCREKLYRFRRIFTRVFIVRVYLSGWRCFGLVKMKTNWNEHTVGNVRVCEWQRWSIWASKTNRAKLINFANVVYVRISTDLWSIFIRCARHTFYYFMVQTNANSEHIAILLLMLCATVQHVRVIYQVPCRCRAVLHEWSIHLAPNCYANNSKKERNLT